MRVKMFNGDHYEELETEVNNFIDSLPPDREVKNIIITQSHSKTSTSSVNFLITVLIGKIK